MKWLLTLIFFGLFLVSTPKLEARQKFRKSSTCQNCTFNSGSPDEIDLSSKPKAHNEVQSRQSETFEALQKKARKKRFGRIIKFLCVGAAISSVIFMILPGKKAKSGNGGRLPPPPTPAESGNGGCLPPLSPPPSQDPSYLQNFSEPPSPSPAQSLAPKHVINRPRQNSWPIASPVRENSIDELSSPSLSPDFRFGLQRPLSMESDSRSRSQSLPRSFGCPPARVTKGTTSPDSLVDWTRRTQ